MSIADQKKQSAKEPLTLCQIVKIATVNNFLKKWKPYFLGMFVYDNQLTVFGGHGTGSRSIEVYNGTSWDISYDILAKSFTFGVLVEAKCAA